MVIEVLPSVHSQGIRESSVDDLSFGEFSEGRAPLSSWAELSLISFFMLLRRSWVPAKHLLQDTGTGGLSAHAVSKAHL